MMYIYNGISATFGWRIRVGLRQISYRSLVVEQLDDDFHQIFTWKMGGNHQTSTRNTGCLGFQVYMSTLSSWWLNQPT